MEASHGENPSPKARWIRAKVANITSQIMENWRMARKVGEDDPRRIVHGVKVGLAIALISIFYYFEPLFDGLGLSAMWAVITVVVVFEFSVGATLGKGINRALATAFGASLGAGAHNLAILSGDKAQPLVLGLVIFLVAALVTFMRFIPKLKARYDYGLMITILTVSMICVSGYREETVLVQAHCRISTILIGTTTAVATCILICPVWAGQDLHNLVANNIEKLSNFLEEFGEEYFNELGAEICDKKKEHMEGFKSILNSKVNEDSLVNLAKWEPPHGKFKYRHPWEEYLKIGSLTRQCACTFEALNRYLRSDGQAPKEVKAKLENICLKMSQESGKALKELSTSFKNMTNPSLSAKTHIHNAQTAAKSLDSFLRMTVWDDHHLSDVFTVATVPSLLLDAVSSTATIAESVLKLGKLARFKETEEFIAGDDKPTVNRGLGKVAPAVAGSSEHVMTVEEEAEMRFPKYKEQRSLDMVQ